MWWPTVARGCLMASMVASGCRSSGAEPHPWLAVLERSRVRDPRVVAAMLAVRRADFLPAGVTGREFEDRPLDIGEGQTTSQPSLIALMLQELRLKPGCRVLEVGTGCGYQTALLGQLCGEVYSIEIVESLARKAAAVLEQKGYRNVKVRAGDGYLGWPEHAPFDGIVVSAGAAKIPRPLVDQLGPGATMVIPVGIAGAMTLQLVTRLPDGGSIVREDLPVAFVPLTGEAATRDRALTRSDAGD